MLILFLTPWFPCNPLGEAARKAGFVGPLPTGKVKSLFALHLPPQVLLNPNSQRKAVRLFSPHNPNSQSYSFWLILISEAQFRGNAGLARMK